MRYSQTIRINDRTFLPNRLAEPYATDDYEKEVLQFAENWLAGTTDFSLQTSGSTGTPKVITISRRSMLASAEATVRYLGIKPGTPVTVPIDIRYIGGKMQLVRALTHDLPLQVFSPQANVTSLFSSIDDLGLLAIVPLQLDELAKANLSLLNKATAVLVGGGVIREDLLQSLRQVKTAVYHTYGMTETVSHIALRKISGVDPSAHFSTLPGVKISTDHRGCLAINGPMTDGKEIVTNDIVEITSSSEFLFVGRADSVINSGGVKLHPEQIDQQVAGQMQSFFPGCRFFAIGASDQRLGQRLALVIESSDDRGKEALMASLKATLPRYHAPKDIIFVQAFEKTPSGKIDKLATLAKATG